MALLKTKIHTELHKSHKRTTRETAGWMEVRKHRVMINQEELLPNSALPSNPELLLRPPRNRHQTLQTNLKDPSNLPITDPLHNQRSRFLTGEMRDLGFDRRPSSPNTRTEDIPTTADRMPMIAVLIDHALPLPRSSRKRSEFGLPCLLNLQIRNPYISGNLAMNQSLVQAHMGKFLRRFTYTPKTRWL